MKHPHLIQKLSLDQKISLLSGRSVWCTYSVESAGVPAISLSDGPHGIRKQLGTGDHMGMHPSQQATCFPTAAGLANSWDPALTQTVGRAIGEEAVCQQVNVLLGPGVNMKRSPLGGRNFEYYSEDPYLAGKLAAGFIRGVQSNGIAACPKHFAANNQELLRLSSDSVVDERTLRELYLTAFEILVKESAPKSIMSSYNKLNGTYSNENSWLLTDVLRGEWGFDGFVVTDWGGSNDHASGVRAGSSLEMPGTMGDSDQELFSALADGSLSHEMIDLRVDELLDVVLSTHSAVSEGPRDFDRAAHHALARYVAAQTMVLLKNEGNILPLTPGVRVAIVGDLAFQPRYQGAGSSMVNPTQLDLPVDAWRDSGTELIGAARGYLRDGRPDPSLKAEALALANRADAVVLYLGLPEVSESEGMDRISLSLPACQNELAQELASANSNLVVVLAGGGAMVLPWLEKCKALIAAYLPGQAGAGAVVDVLTGRINPSAKLAESWPLAPADAPNVHYFPGRQRTAEYREGPYIGYRYYQTVGLPVQFPFGFGLSFTHFQYSDLTVTREGVCFFLTNIGPRAGAEIAQLYVSLPQSQVFRPALELKGFAKVALDPGERRQIEIPFDERTFRYFNVSTGRWEIEGGSYFIQVGASAQDICLTASLELTGTGAPCPYDRDALPSYYSGRVQTVSDQEFETLLGRSISPSNWDSSAALDLNDSISQLVFAKNPPIRLLGKWLAHLERESLQKGVPNLTVLFIRSMTFRTLAKMSNGMVTMAMSRSILDMANGHFFRGLGKTATCFFAGRKRARVRKKKI